MQFINGFVDFLVKRSRRECGFVVRTIATLLGAALFIAGIPALVLWAGTWLKTGPILPLVVARPISLICFIVGIPWMLSVVFWQLIRGKGTPVPVVPTKYFLASGPYRYVRNPMILGFFLYLLGWAFLSNQWGALWAVLLVIGLLIVEIKLVEEQELEKRFGNAYREYKKETPFVLPKWRRNQGA